MSQLAINQLILIIVAGVAAARVGRSLRIPEVLPLLLTGFLLGGDVLGILRPADLGINLDFLALFLVPIILFYDGMKTDVRALRSIWLTVFSINTVAVVVTVSGIGFFSHLFLGLSWPASFLLGAILASTDPAAIIPVLRKLKISKRVSSVLEAETALNDASAITIFLVVLGLATGGAVTVGEGVSQFLYFAVVSTIVGAVIGFAFAELFRQFRIESNVVLASFVVLLVTYSVSESLGISSVIAVVVTALIFRQFLQSSSVDSINRLRTLSVWEDFNFLAISVIFLVLGSQIQLSKLGPYLFVGSLIAVSFMLVVRPLTVLVSMAIDRSFSLREKVLIAWLGGPRGSVSAALASIIIARAGEGLFPPAEAEAIFNITLVVIILTVVVTSLTATRAVRRLTNASEDSFEDSYRSLSTELKTMMIAWRQLREDWKAGLVSNRMYEEINKELERSMAAIEGKLDAIIAQAPYIAERARAQKVREVVITQLNALENAYENKEILEQDYVSLVEKFSAQLDRLSEIEAQETTVKKAEAQEKTVKKAPRR